MRQKLAYYVNRLPFYRAYATQKKNMKHFRSRCAAVL